MMDTQTMDMGIQGTVATALPQRSRNPALCVRQGLQVDDRHLDLIPAADHHQEEGEGPVIDLVLGRTMITPFPPYLQRGILEILEILEALVTLEILGLEIKEIPGTLAVGGARRLQE
ncbi:hypothetical protein N7468_000551 [Penicillium chermesinum]|uniref:Uncharacterized protein n=1 Tax=Penicillium chermesinum TaxID=63820 RepID=A0A9W9PMF3_9EURO|nr:uncharacterized protein N7468_000551 [Penicillium chermesinum]KAJ5249100.1 hypothetical protein N7468_000551 [Penicillium chermesinum]